MSENVLHAIKEALYEDIVQNGLSEIYQIDELCKWSSTNGVSIEPDELVRIIRQNCDITFHFRGGHSNTQVTRKNPNREATLREIGEGQYSLDTEAAVQAGLQNWFHTHGFVAKCEAPDSENTIREICKKCSIDHLPDVPTSRSTHCRDLMAHSVDSPADTFHIIEIKGRTKVVSDFYDTFGQVFPIEDPAVTRGWTNNKVPKHGLCLKHAHRFLDTWRSNHPQVSVTLVVAVPDFPPHCHDVNQFFGGQSKYYSRQVETFQNLLSNGEHTGDATFERLLHHLEEQFDFRSMLAPNDADLHFRFWGYQGLHFVRDFATNRPVDLSSTMRRVP